MPTTQPDTAGSDAPARASAAPIDWFAVQADFLHSGMSLRRVAHQRGIKIVNYASIGGRPAVGYGAIDGGDSLSCAPPP